MPPWRDWLPHHFAILGNGAFAFENLHDNRPGGHERDQTLVERLLRVDGVKGLGLCLAEADTPLGDHAQPRFFEPCDDFACQVPARRVRFDDGKRALDGHVLLQGWKIARLIAMGFAQAQGVLKARGNADHRQPHRPHRGPQHPEGRERQPARRPPHRPGRA